MNIDGIDKFFSLFYKSLYFHKPIRKMETCMNCFTLEGKWPYNFFCLLCGKFIALCLNCHMAWPIKLNHKIYDDGLVCSMSCLFREILYVIKNNYELPNILIEHQEEILYENIKPIVKALIKELNYFINDILNEIIEY